MVHIFNFVELIARWNFLFSTFILKRLSDSLSHLCVPPTVRIPTYTFIQPFIQPFYRCCSFSFSKGPFCCCYYFISMFSKKVYECFCISFFFLICRKLLFCCSCNYNRHCFSGNCQRWGVRPRGIYQMCGTAGNVAFNIRIFNWRCQERGTG